MKLIRSVLALCALTLAFPAFAQATYHTPSGTHVQGVVPLACNTTRTNCQPVAGDANGTVSQPALSSTFWNYAADALGAATELAIRDGAAGTVIWRGKINTAGWLDGMEITFSPALRGTANTLVEIVTLTASVTGSVYCNLQGYTGS